jgi:hypothetical protein
MIVLLVAAASMLFPHRAVDHTTAEHIEQLALKDSSVQSRAHRILVLVLGTSVVGLIASPVARQRLVAVGNRSPMLKRFERTAAVGLPFILVLAASWEYRGTPAAMGLASTVIAVSAAFALRSKQRLATLAGGVLVGFAALVFVPGLLKDPALPSDSASIEFTEWHYSIVVSQGDRLAKGLRLFTEVVPHYGVLAPALLGFAERQLGVFNFGEHIRLVQLAQVLFGVGAILCYYLWSGRSWLPTAICGIPVVAFAGTLQGAVLAPNQSGWRFLVFPIGLLLLVLQPSVASRPRIFGVVWGGLILLNPETGIAVGAAYLTSILLEHEGRRNLLHLPGAVGRFLLGSVLTLALFAVGFRFAFGYLPVPDPNLSGTTFARFSAGYGGLSLYFGVAWILILSHSVYVVTRAFLALPDLDERGRTRAAIAVTIIVWFAYFFNRPAAWDLWTFYFLYGFLVVDLFQPDSLVRAALALKGGRLSFGLAILMVFLSEHSHNAVWAVRGSIASLTAPHQPETELSGVLVTPAFATDVLEKALFVRDQASRGSIYYFTANAYFVPLLSGYYPHLPMADAYSESFTDADFERLVAWVLTKPPSELLFDDPDSRYAGPPQRRHFMSRLKARLSSVYTKKDKVAGWEVWALSGA